MTYPGGKNGAGVYHAIINQMPKHRVYIEPFLGSGAILRHKRPAAISYACEANADAARAFIERDDMPFYIRPEDKTGKLLGAGAICEMQMYLPDQKKPSLHVAVGTFDQWRTHSGVHVEDLGRDALIYLDPPYLMETRSSKDKRYDPEFADWFSHTQLLDLILTLRCNVMISGYDHPLYNDKLAGWRKTQYTGFTRGGGARVEHLWMNFAQAAELHDYRYLGANYRERENLKKQQRRWIAKLRAMPQLQRYALMAALEETAKSAGLAENGGAIVAPATSTIAENGVAADKKVLPETAMGEAEIGPSETSSLAKSNGAAGGIAKSNGAGPGRSKPLLGELAIAALIADPYFEEDLIDAALIDKDPLKYLCQWADVHGPSHQIDNGDGTGWSYTTDFIKRAVVIYRTKGNVAHGNAFSVPIDKLARKALSGKNGVARSREVTHA